MKGRPYLGLLWKRLSSHLRSAVILWPLSAPLWASFFLHPVDKKTSLRDYQVERSHQWKWLSSNCGFFGSLPAWGELLTWRTALSGSARLRAKECHLSGHCCFQVGISRYRRPLSLTCFHTGNSLLSAEQEQRACGKEGTCFYMGGCVLEYFGEGRALENPWFWPTKPE